MEECRWECEHLKCTKLCSEPCDRELCKHPSNEKVRKCGHQSIGVCGEQVPSLCRICNKDEVEEIFFGTEADEGARFIQLVDCKHIIEVDSLIHWMNAEPETSESNSENGTRNSIQLKKCPKCKTEIRHTKALNTFIQASLKDVQQVKLKTYGTKNENRTLQRDLNKKAHRVLDARLYECRAVSLFEIYKEIRNGTKFNKHRERVFEPRPKQVLIQLSNKLNLVETLREICSTLEYPETILRKNFDEAAISKFQERIVMANGFIKEYQNSEQMRHDIETEISFLQMMGEVIRKATIQTFSETAIHFLIDAFELAHKRGRATELVQSEFKRLVDEAFKEATGLGISLEEKNMVLKAMDLQRGHWYKCPNGHVYCITECGGAMERSVCPDCKAVIGGASHSLDPSNALASEMDGAIEPAWPTNLMEQLRPFMD